jgi:hypothetical protein
MPPETDAGDPKQYFVAVQFADGNTEPVMMPVDNLAALEDEGERQKILDSAWAYFQRARFARESNKSPVHSRVSE